MVKITVILTHPNDEESFDTYYFKRHVPIIESLPNVKQVSISKVFESQFPGGSPYIVAEFCYDNKDMMKASLDSTIGQLLYADVPHLMRYLEHEPMILFSEN
jgi:uncharacterized protein (TIGR02118 family)